MSRFADNSPGSPPLRGLRRPSAGGNETQRRTLEAARVGFAPMFTRTRLLSSWREQTTFGVSSRARRRRRTPPVHAPCSSSLPFVLRGALFTRF